MPPFSAQPAEKSALEKLGVEPVRFCAAMLARHGHAARINHMNFNTAGHEPAGEPKPVAAGFVSNGNARDPASGFNRFVPPAE